MATGQILKDLLDKQTRSELIPQFADDAAYLVQIPSPSNGAKYYNTTTKLYRTFKDGSFEDDGVATTLQVTSPSTATNDLWQSATSPAFLSAFSVRIDKGNNIESRAIKGAPIRYSSDGLTWKYGQIIDKTTNPTTVDLTVDGVELTPTNTQSVQIGSPSLIREVEIRIPNLLTTGDDKISSVLKSELVWPFAQGFLVRALAKLNTASSTDFLLEIARGLATNRITNSQINLGQATNRVSTGTDIDEANYQIEFEEKVFINIDQTSNAQDLTVKLVAILQEFQFTEFVPDGPPTLPYAFLWTGSRIGTLWTATTDRKIDIEFFSLATDTGNSANRGDDTLSRFGSAVVFDDTRSFNCSGVTTVADNSITFILAQLTTGNASDRGDDTLTRQNPSGISGDTDGFICGGSLRDDISTFILSVDSGDASNRGLISSGDNSAGAGVFNAVNGFICGGKASTSAAAKNVIDFFSTTITTGNTSDRGDLIEVLAQLAGVSDLTNEFGYLLGGDTNGGTSTSGQTNTIQSIDTSLVTGDAVDRADLATSVAGNAGSSGSDTGYSSGGVIPTSTITNEINKFAYTTGTPSVSNRGVMLDPVHSMAVGA